jgi:alpha-D-ribose 1-methylphosphonate 5-triphosphate synthase subunit PhnH
MNESSLPAYTLDEARDRETFIALTDAFSFPGRPVTLRPIDDADTPVRIGLALLDLETSFHAVDPLMELRLLRTGARRASIRDAEYLFFSSLDPQKVNALRAVRNGSMLRPDDSATLIINCTFASGSVFRWTGPGIHQSIEVRLGAIPAAFWTLRRAAGPFPLGFDVILCDGDVIMGLPRSTAVQSV